MKHEKFQNEKWKDIPGFEGRYQASDLGRIKSVFRYKKVLKPHKNPKGYCVVGISANGKHQTRTVHALVLSAFVGPRPYKFDGAHLDGKPGNNGLTNLRWVSRKENHAHKRLHGTEQVGEKNGQAKLRSTDVQLMVKMDKIGVPKRMIARAVRISEVQVRDILAGRWWKAVSKVGTARKKSSPASQSLGSPESVEE